MILRYVKLFIFSLLLLYSPLTAEVGEEEFKTNVIDRAVKVTNGKSYGNGVIVANDYVLTAAHIIDGHDDIRIAMLTFDIPKSANDLISCKKSRVDLTNDLALLKCKGIPDMFTRVKVKTPSFLQPLFMFSLREGEFESRSYRAIIRKTHDVGARDAFLVYGTFKPGNSGSALWLTEGDELFLSGVVSAGYSKIEFGYITYTERVIRILRGIK